MTTPAFDLRSSVPLRRFIGDARIPLLPGTSISQVALAFEDDSIASVQVVYQRPDGTRERKILFLRLPEPTVFALRNKGYGPEVLVRELPSDVLGMNVLQLPSDTSQGKESEVQTAARVLSQEINYPIDPRMLIKWAAPHGDTEHSVGLVAPVFQCSCPEGAWSEPVQAGTRWAALSRLMDSFTRGEIVDLALGAALGRYAAEQLRQAR